MKENNGVCLLLLLFIYHVEAYQHFQDQIPNGGNVPHPCKPNYQWQGVGHRNSAGGGTRNPFGQAFDDNGKIWNATLCNQDSDNDGRTNGEELGDPECTWTPGTLPNVTAVLSLSHPGVCEPWDSLQCMSHNQWEFCDSQAFSCPALDNTDDVRELELRFAATVVPAQETTYICQTFDLPNDQDYHLVASQPITNNSYVMHHTVVFGCNEGGEDVASSYINASECGMAPNDYRCQAILDVWSLGSAGYCENENMGVKIGPNGFMKVVVQHHWNNPQERSDYIDSSGMRLFYTPNLRPNDGGVMLMGQEILDIQPFTSSASFDSELSKACSSYVMKDAPINIVSTFMHMHLIGKSMKVDHYRGTELLRSLGEDEVYNYDSPVLHVFDPPVELQAGDRAKLTCTFDSSSRTEVTPWGDATSQEMCYSFIRYYPYNAALNFVTMRNNGDTCATYAMYTMVSTSDNAGFMVGSCNVASFIKNEALATFIQIGSTCDTNLTDASCLPDCKSLLQGYRDTHSCLGDAVAMEYIWSYLSNSEAIDQAYAAFQSCDADLGPLGQFPDNGGHVINAWHQATLMTLVAALLLTV